MTVKEIASFTGKTERAVQNWIKKANEKSSLINEKSSLSSPLYPADYNIDDVEIILECSSMSKDAVNILMQNARGNDVEKTNKVQDVDYAVLAQVVAVAVTTAMKPIIENISMVNNKSKNDVVLLPEPVEQSPRQYLNRLVREYAEVKHISYQESWGSLYNEILYRCEINVKVRARNKGLKPIDILERENMLLQACSIIKTMM